jgi:glycosyltransferase involved in cell wall biosynthesis
MTAPLIPAAERIGVVGLRGVPGVMGGIETHVEQLYPRLKRLAPDRMIDLAERAPYVDVERREWSGLTLWPLPALRNKYLETILHTLLAILFLRFRRRSDLIHIHAIGPGLLAPLARALGMRVLLTHHGQDYDRAKWNGPAKAVLQFGERVAVGAAHETIVVSETVARSLRARFAHKAAHIHAIPNGASATFRTAGSNWDAHLLDRFGLQPQGYILGVGRLVPEKAFHELIAAHAKSGDPRTLVIAGGTDHQDAYTRELLAQASDRVVFAGFQPHDVLRTLYAAAALFVMPSHHEGLPIAALEAAATDTPMLLSDIPANLEIGLPVTCYFPVGSVDALAAKLAKPASTFAIDGAAISARFDWDEIARATDRVIARALARA